MIELTDGNVNLILDDDILAGLRGALGNLTANDGIQCALLIDTAGKLITVDGSAGHLDTATIAALAAGDYATTRALARRVGEKEFSLVFQRSQHLNAYLHAVSEEALLVVLFTESIPVGGVRVAVKTAQTAIRRTLLRANRTVTGPEEVRKLLADHDSEGAEESGGPTGSAPGSEEEEELNAEASSSGVSGTAVASGASGSGIGSGSVSSPSSPMASSSPSSASAPPLSSSPSPSAPIAPAADQIRAFWRIKGMAEDCIRIGIPNSRPKEWQTARDRIARATAELAGSTPDRAGPLLVEAESLLRAAYESALSLNRHAQSGEQEWEGVVYLHHLLELSTEPFTRVLGEAGPVLLPYIDRESIDRHPAILTEGTGAQRIARSTLSALKHLTPDSRRQAIARAMLDLLINRLMVVRKIFGVVACRGLLAAWREHTLAATPTLTRLGLHPVIRFLFDDAVKRWPDVRDSGSAS